MVHWYFRRQPTSIHRPRLAALLALLLSAVGALHPAGPAAYAAPDRAPSAPARAATTSPLELIGTDRLRFYTPNLIAPGATGSPPRDTAAEQITTIFTDEAEMAPLLQSVDVYGFFGASVARADAAFEQMLARAIPMLELYGVKLALEVGGPLGYAPPTVYGGDTGGQNGIKSAQLDLGPSRVGKIERLGGTVDYLMLDGALRRTIRNGEHSRPHAAYVAIGAGNSALRYNAATPGSAGNAISVAHVVGAPLTNLSVTVDGTSITVILASDAGGSPTSTALEVQAAINQSAEAAALVTAVLPRGSDGSGVASVRTATSLAFGDDGLNMSIEQSVAEVVAYIATVHAARPGIRFVLLENSILWPYEGRAGYQSTAYPGEQRPDFYAVWDELIAQLDAAGLRSLLVGMHNDHPIEYPERLIRSINQDADDWYARTLRLQAQVEADGIAFAQLYNSVWGGDPAQDASHAAPYASDEYFQQRVLAHVHALEGYRLHHRPDLSQADHFALDAFFYYPRVVTPASIAYSTDDTYLEALALFESFSMAASAEAEMEPPRVALVAGTRAGLAGTAVQASWTAPSSPDIQVELQRREDDGEWTRVGMFDAAAAGVRLRLAFERRHELRVRAVDASGSAGPWALGDPFLLSLHDQLDESVGQSGAWREVADVSALGGSYDRTRRRGATTWLASAGDQLAWIGQRGPRHGRAEVLLDGQATGYVRLRADRIRSRQVLHVTPWLVDASSTLAIRNASDKRVDVDAFVVLDVGVPSS